MNPIVRVSILTIPDGHIDLAAAGSIAISEL